MGIAATSFIQISNKAVTPTTETPEYKAGPKWSTFSCDRDISCYAVQDF